MDDTRFEIIAKNLAVSLTRRRSLRLLAGAVLGGLVTPLGFPKSEVGDAAKRERPKSERKRQRKRTLYPELRTLAAYDLGFDQVDIAGEQVHVLRFSNTVWNAGEGRLELKGQPNPKVDGARNIYQIFYDAPIGGTRTKRKVVASDILYHPSHEHYHFENFASYLLLKQDASGTYQKTTKKGTKTSFCIYDYITVEGTNPAQYIGCGFELTGLTPGWGDTYHASLPDQWIVLGTQPLGDGEYAIQSTADPKGLIDEGGRNRERNNTAVTYFTVQGGQISNVRSDSPWPQTAKAKRETLSRAR